MPCDHCGQPTRSASPNRLPHLDLPNGRSAVHAINVVLAAWDSASLLRKTDMKSLRPSSGELPTSRPMSVAHFEQGKSHAYGSREKRTEMVLVCVVALAAPASAGAITVTNVQVPYSEGVTLTGGQIPSDPENVGIAGEIVLTTDVGILYTWCVDLFHTISLGGSYTYTPDALTTQNNGTSPGTSTALTSTQINNIEALAAYGTGQMLTRPTAELDDFSAALQSAIWEVEYGTVATGSAGMEADLAAINRCCQVCR